MGLAMAVSSSTCRRASRSISAASLRAIPSEKAVIIVPITML